MAGVVADDRCPRCGGPLTAYKDGSKRCKPCRAAERQAQQRRKQRQAQIDATPLGAAVAGIMPTETEVDAAQTAWRTGRAAEVLHSQNISASEVGRLAGVSRRAALNWFEGQAPAKRHAAAAAKVLLAADVVHRDPGAGDAATGAPVPYADLARDPRECWDDFEAFRARYLGSVSTPWQVMAAQRVVELLDTPHKEHVVINCPQGAGKSRTFTHDLLAWLTVRRRSIRGVIGSNSKNMAEMFCANLRDTLERKAPALARDEDKARGVARDADATLPADYGWFRTPNHLGATLWRRDRLVVAQHGGIASTEKDYTWGTFSRETRILGLRCDFMVWDDLVNLDMLRNPDQVDDLQAWWHTEVETRVDGNGLLLLVGQRLRSNDLYRHCLDQRVISDELDDPDAEPDRPKYHQIKVKAHYPELCTGDHPRDAEPTTFDPAGEPTGGSCLSEPRRNPWRECLERQAAGTFETTFQQEDTDPTAVLVQQAWVQACWDDDRTIGQVPTGLPPAQRIVRYITVDPSPTRYWGVIDWLYVLPADEGIETGAGYRYVLDVHRARMTADQFLDQTLDGTYTGLIEEWTQRARAQGTPVEWLVVEKNAAQRYLLQSTQFRNWKATRSVEVLEHETTNNRNDPDYGVWATLPNAWRHARVRLPGADRTSRQAVHPLVAEVTTYPDGATDDLVMSSWFAELHLDTLVGPMRTNSRRFHSDEPTWATGADQMSHATRRVAEMVARQAGQHATAV